MPILYSGVQYSGMWTRQQQAQAIAAGTWPGLSLLYGWGRNNTQYPAIGLNNTTSYSSPKQTGNLTGDWAKISAVASGSTVAVKTNGTLWSWGYGIQGALGYAGSYISSPKQVGALTDWLSVTSGYNFCLAIKTNGTLWSWGYNAQGQLGHGDVTYLSSPKQVGSLTTWLLTACGAYHALAIKTDGTLWAWGFNTFGQLGLNDTISRSSPVQVGALTTWSKIAGGRNCSIVIKTDGTLWAWGTNFYGQLGLGNTTYYSSPKQVGALTTWSTIAGGNFQTVAIKTDGTLWTWGRNNVGQLGLGNSITYSSPKQVGTLTTWNALHTDGALSTSTFAIKTDKTLWAWGGNLRGQLGLGNTADYFSPKQVGALANWTQVSNGGDTTIATLST